jgi:LysM repeat protein
MHDTGGWLLGPDGSDDPAAVDAGVAVPPAEELPPDLAAADAPLASDVDPFAACRYLFAASGGWRASDAIRDHRCAALDPPSPIALEKQRRLCLTGAHAVCPTFLAAREERGRTLGSVDPGWAPARPVVRTAPVVVGSPQRDRAFAGLLMPARLGEVALGVMAIVVVVLLGSRLLGGAGVPEPSPIAAVAASATPAASVDAGPSAVARSPGPDESGSPSGSSSSSSASPDASAASSPLSSASPAASPKRTHKVRSGETLSMIAAKYGTTVTALVKLNKIKNPSLIHAGLVLRLP